MGITPQEEGALGYAKQSSVPHGSAATHSSGHQWALLQPSEVLLLGFNLLHMESDASGYLYIQISFVLGNPPARPFSCMI